VGQRGGGGRYGNEHTLTAPGPPGAPAVIAIDGGNSKTDVALVAANGALLASVRGPGLDPQHHGVAETVEMLGGLVDKVVASAGTRGWPLARHLCACVANADLPEDEERVAEALRAQGWTVTTSVVNDTFAVLRAGLDDGPSPARTADGRLSSPARTADGRLSSPARTAGGFILPAKASRAASGHWGVAVTCGAGINCVGVAPDGRTHRYLALGTVSGDWGGGYGLGLASVWWAMRAEDGRGPGTVLRETVPAHFGLDTMYDVAVGLDRGAFSEDEVVGLAPVLFATANAGDQVARDLIVRQGGEICLMVLATMRQLELTGPGTPVVLGGGLLTARDPLLTATIADRLAVDAPGSVMRLIDVPPIAGAALLGLDQVQATPDAHARLRAAYDEPAPA
jgi:N-acetylglucosamine kinase-like BadF-type ATPase